MEDTIEQLIEVWRADPVKMSELRVFAIDKHHTFRFINRRWHKTHNMDAYGYAAVNKLDRGKILSIFAKLEFLVNECIILALFLKKPDVLPHIKYFKRDDKPVIENTIKSSSPILCSDLPSKLQEIAFKKRIEYIEKLGLVDGATKDVLTDLADVRNFLAHEWDETLAEYKNGKLKDKTILNALSADLVAMFGAIIRKYSELQEQIDYETILVTYLDSLSQNSGN